MRTWTRSRLEASAHIRRPHVGVSPHSGVPSLAPRLRYSFVTLKAGGFAILHYILRPIVCKFLRGSKNARCSPCCIAPRAVGKTCLVGIPEFFVLLCLRFVSMRELASDPLGLIFLGVFAMPRPSTSPAQDSTCATPHCENCNSCPPTTHNTNSHLSHESHMRL